MAKVSIIVPVYNVAPYLGEALECLEEQTLRDMEIICINDGSTDRSLDILQQHASSDKRIQVKSQKNRGYGSAVNVGLNAALGEYVAIFEPDDLVPPNMYEDLFHVAENYELDFVKADFYRFVGKPGGQIDRTLVRLSENPEDYNVVFDPSSRPETVLFTMNTWSGIYRRGFLEKWQIRHQETPGASFQDNGFYFQTFAYARRAMLLDKPYYMNRRDNPASSVLSREKVYCMNQEYDYIRRILKGTPDVWERFKYVYWRKKFSNYIATWYRIAEGFRKDYVSWISAEFGRALSLGELSREAFEDDAWNLVLLLIRDPEGFSYKLSHSGTLGQEKIRHTVGYQVGRILTAVPSRVRKVSGSRGEEGEEEKAPIPLLQDETSVFHADREQLELLDFLMDNPDVFKEKKFSYWVDKAAGDMALLPTIGDGFKKEYLLHIRREYETARELGHLREEDFDAPSWEQVQLLLKDVDAVYHESLIAEDPYVKKARNSSAYKAGKGISALGAALRRMVHNAVSAVKRTLRSAFHKLPEGRQKKLKKLLKKEEPS